MRRVRGIIRARIEDEFEIEIDDDADAEEAAGQDWGFVEGREWEVEITDDETIEP